jgi:hypothetical protein
LLTANFHAHVGWIFKGDPQNLMRYVKDLEQDKTIKLLSDYWWLTSMIGTVLPGIIAGAMLAFVISLDDVVITEFVKSGGQDTLPTYMLGQIRRAVTPDVNAISTALLVLTVILLTAFFLLTRKRG